MVSMNVSELFYLCWIEESLIVFRFVIILFFKKEFIINMYI